MQNTKNMDLATGDHEIKIYPKKGKLILFAGGFLLSLIGCVCAFSDIEVDTTNWKVVPALIVFIPLCLLGFIFCLRRLKKPSPAMIISESGVTDSATFLGVGYLSWEEIEFVHSFRYSGKKTLGIVPKNCEKVILGQNLLNRQWLRINKLMSGSLINIPQSILPIKIEEVIDQMKSKNPRLLVKSD